MERLADGRRVPVLSVGSIEVGFEVSVDRGGKQMILEVRPPGP